MAPMVLTLVDTVGIQEYIFGSNDLGQNIGASEQVTRATSIWIFDALEAASLTHNGRRNERDRHLNVWEINDQAVTSTDAHVVYAGGGNAVVLFNNLQNGRSFVGRLSSHVLRHAPELQLAYAHESFDWEDPRGVRTALEKARARLGEQRDMQGASLPILGLGVTAACDFTARPVYARDREGAYISRAVQAKLDARDSAEARLRDALRCARKFTDKDQFIFDFDEFGEANESSYIAVIHADGNGMGERIKALPGEHNADYVRSLRSFSASVRDVAQKALCVTVDRLLTTRRQEKDGDYFGTRGEIRARRGRLPFRPVVFGGDDVTFVSDGRLGLALAQTYLAALNGPDASLSDGQPLYSRAGIAVVKNHYPFARAYHLADDLAGSARDAFPVWQEEPEPVDCAAIDFGQLPWFVTAQNLKGPDGRPGTRCRLIDQRIYTLDWHFATTGALLALEDIRAREYTVGNEGNLLMRPIRLRSNMDADWRTWPVFRYFTHEFLWNGEAWQGRRNKVKALRDALRAGPAAVQQFLENYQVKERRLPQLAGYEELSRTGWDSGSKRCGYFDAIEATDFFVELEAGA